MKSDSHPDPDPIAASHPSQNHAPTPGPWCWSFFCKPNGEPIQTVQDVADVLVESAFHAERTELWGVSLMDEGTNPDGRATVVCYTGNGPNAHNNARLIASAPALLDACKRLLKFNEELCVDIKVSTHYPSADFARAVIAGAEGEA